MDTRRSFLYRALGAVTAAPLLAKLPIRPIKRWGARFRFPFRVIKGGAGSSVPEAGKSLEQVILEAVLRQKGKNEILFKAAATGQSFFPIYRSNGMPSTIVECYLVDPSDPALGVGDLGHLHLYIGSISEDGQVIFRREAA